MARTKQAAQIRDAINDLTPDFTPDGIVGARGRSPGDFLLSVFQDTRLDAATLDLPARTDDVEVLIPRDAPNPPNLVNRRPVSAAEALAVTAASPVDVITPQTDALPEFIITPGDVVDEICL